MASLIKDKEFIEAALRGFEQQRALIDEKMAELRQQLSRIRPVERTGRTRELSPEARQRIAAAQRKRWARTRRETARQTNGAKKG